jgi:translation initiation factor 1 (eIF-1/SUI1)
MKEPRITPDDKPDGLTHSPFAALRARHGTPGGAPQESPDCGGATTPPPPDARARRVVVQREKKGRSGKTVTRITGLDAASRVEIVGRLKRALGCGASIESDDVLLQGALTERAARWLRENAGVDVTIGN